MLLLVPFLELLPTPALLPFMVGSSACPGVHTTLAGTGNSSAGRLFCRQLELLPRAQLPSALLLPCEATFWSTLLLHRPAVQTGLPTGCNLTGQEMGNIFWRCREGEAGWICGVAPSAPLGWEKLTALQMLSSWLKQG